MTTTRRADPEPFSIILVIIGATGPAISALNYWKTHHKRLPYRTRGKLVDGLDLLSAEVRYLRADVDDIEGVFKGAQFPDGPTIRLGNGALLTPDQFRRYQKLADRVFARIKKINAVALKVHGLAFQLPYVDQLTQTNVTGEAIDRAERLLQSRDYSVDKAFEELRALIRDLETLIHKLEADLGRDQR